MRCNSLLLTLLSATANAASCRDRLDWPFAIGSIWNTPIGTGASYEPAGVFAAGLPQPSHFHHDDDHIWINLNYSFPAVPWFGQGAWGLSNHSLYCTRSPNAKLLRELNIDPDLSLTLFGHNNGAGLLYPGGELYTETQPVYRCDLGGPFFSLPPFCKQPFTSGPPNCTASVRGNGTYGAHGGSGLSAVGGAIRVWELGQPIRHALKIELAASLYYYDQPPALVWPALHHDGYAFNQSNPAHYGGSNPHFAPGALLAVPPSVNVSVTTEAGGHILDALRGYGGYIVDDTVTKDRGTLCTEAGYGEAFQARYGMDFEQTSGPFKDDLTAIFKALHIVTNNAPGSVGGGGKPTRPLAPPFCD